MSKKSPNFLRESQSKAFEENNPRQLMRGQPLNIVGTTPKHMAKTFQVIIEQDEDGMYVGRVPQLRGCLTQGATLDELMKNIREAILLCLEDEEEPPSET
jgi:predicted RNase H-like HicB family nuclease